MSKIVNYRKDEHHFCRRYDQSNWSGNALYNPFLIAATFSFDQLPNYADFTSLFDRFKINFIKLYVYLKIDPSAQAAATAAYPKLYWTKDYDDSSAPATLNEMREHKTCKVKVLNPNRPVIITLRPAILSEVYRTAVTYSYSPKWKQWIDCATPNVPHYGLKIGIDDLTNTNYQVKVEGKMWFSCKDTR